MATKFYALLILTVGSFCRLIASESNFDWSNALSILTEQKQLWDQQRINSYIYHLSLDAILPPCDVAPKYVMIRNNAVYYVQYDFGYLEHEMMDCGTEIHADKYMDYFSIDELVRSRDYWQYFNMEMING